MPSHLELIFDRFLVRFYCQLQTHQTFKIIVFPKEKQGFFNKSRFEVGIDFGMNFVPTCIHFSSENHQKSF